MRATAGLRFSSADDGRWMHGFQLIGEYLLHEEAADAHLLWLVTGLITPDIAFVGMLGGRATTDGNEVRGRAIANASAYHAIGRDVWLGAEVNTAWDPHAGHVHVRAIPQVHVSLHRSFRLQLGLGIEHTDTGTQPFGGGRVIIQM